MLLSSQVNRSLEDAALTASRDDFMAVFGLKRGEKQFAVVSVPSMTELWIGNYSERMRLFHYSDVIVEDQVHTPRQAKVNVFNLNSNQLVRTMAEFNGNRILEAYVFQEKVFYCTKTAIYALDGEETNYTKIAQFHKHAQCCNLIILKFDANEFVIAGHIRSEDEVRVMTFTRGSYMAVRDVELECAPKNMQLIGTYEDLLYFRTRDSDGSPFYYVAMREDAEVKRQRIVACHRIYQSCIYNGTLHLDMMETNEERCVTIIDLGSDTVVFRKSVAELGMAYTLNLIPVIRKRLSTDNEQASEDP